MEKESAVNASVRSLEVQDVGPFLKIFCNFPVPSKAILDAETSIPRYLFG